MNNKLSNWELAMIDEIEDVLHDNYDDYETGISISDNAKQEIAREIIDSFDWSELRLEVMEYINKELYNRLDYLRKKRKVCLSLDKEEDDEYETLEMWDSGVF